jgi:hypothetical protein
MKSRIVNLGMLFLMAAVGLLASAGAAGTQTLRQPAESTIQVGSAGERSPAVDLRSVGRKVAPGVLEVDPAAVRGKRIIIKTGNQTAERHLCIGKWDAGAGTCSGVYIEW